MFVENCRCINLYIHNNITREWNGIKISFSILGTKCKTLPFCELSQISMYWNSDRIILFLKEIWSNYNYAWGTFKCQPTTTELFLC